ncbi:GNAT family N-acetyltransferase [Cellulomonas edaphi]|uniref:GNAT family N-acetyltransferase n=1 Tax=Cellulomonas edaphi TaxID=3053468 RepID=A0ABT7S2Q2_9CELL|nr:GNAT family N-acetyltransferase [Cellulomons edaphi]MDM7829891.1 GNAT family N-acetyltransferase [Cellulomons edaphi]
MTTRRLGPGDADQARALFAVMAAAFGEDAEPLGDQYVDALLTDDSFWAVAAFEDDRVVGGITAHTIPMTRSESAEVFVYDLAVHPEHRRRGVAAGLVATLRALAAGAGIADVFVPADADDTEALAFYRSQSGAESPVRVFTWRREPHS